MKKIAYIFCGILYISCVDAVDMILENTPFKDVKVDVNTNKNTEDIVTIIQTNDDMFEEYIKKREKQQPLDFLKNMEATMESLIYLYIIFDKERNNVGTNYSGGDSDMWNLVESQQDRVRHICRDYCSTPSNTEKDANSLYNVLIDLAKRKAGLII